MLTDTLGLTLAAVVAIHLDERMNGWTSAALLIVAWVSTAFGRRSPDG